MPFAADDLLRGAFMLAGGEVGGDGKGKVDAVRVGNSGGSNGFSGGC